MPFLKMRAFRGLWWLFGFSTPVKAISPAADEKHGSPKDRPCRTVRKRLHRATRLLLAILPRRIQSALGYPVCTSIGCAVSPGKLLLIKNSFRYETWSAAGVISVLEVRCSPTKPCGKGSKRKQDDLDEEEEVEQQSWVEALNQELAEEDHVADPDYEVCFFSVGICLVTAKFWDTNLFSCSPVQLRRTVRNTGHTMTLRVTWK